MGLSVGILIFENVEELDFVGPLETFGNLAKILPEENLQIFTVAERSATVKGVNGLQVVPDFTFANCPPVGILVVPGGPGRFVEMKNPAVLQFVKGRAKDAKITTSVCTGAFILAEAGLLTGRRAITHWTYVDELRARGDVTVIQDRFVDDGNIITAAGISAGIDMSLHLIGRLYGPDVASKVARRMEYESPFLAAPQ